MNKNKENAPKIRFPGFTDAWEQRSLGEVAEFNPKSMLPDEFEYVDLESVFGTNLIAHRTESKESAPSRAQRLAQRGDVFYQTVRPYQKNNYLFDLPYDNYVFSTGYAQMRPNIDSYFLLSRVQEELFVRVVLDRSTGTSYPAINSNDLAEIDIKVPIDRDEQTQIGAFFKDLDHLSTLHQRKLNNLKDLKAGLLQKMFPKNGEDFPEVRFPGFTDAWEQRPLDSVFKKIRNAFVGTATPYYVESGNFYMQSNNIKDGKINRLTEVFINDEFYEKQRDKWLHTGDLVMVQSGHVGHTAVITEEFDCTAAHALIMFQEYKEQADPFFLNFQFQTEKAKRKLESINTGNTVKHILASEMKKFEVSIPQIEEQTQIGTFFKDLDHLITLHQRKLEHLQEQKKALLQQMFV